MRKYVLILIFTLNQALAQQLKIGVLRAYNITDVLVSYHKGSYNVYGDSLKKHTILPTESVQIKRVGDKLNLIQGVRNLGYFDTIRIQETLPNHSFRIQGLKPYKIKERKYKNNLLLTTDELKGIKIINEVEMPNYLAGVIESEGGGGRHIEYYKVQAVLSRTYALGHLKKHIKEGFSLCDRVHCQAYHKMLTYTPTIQKAVLETKHIVMVDQNFKLANGFFFANCGGQTSESDFVWNNPIPYCRSVRDTFCVHTKQAHWTKKIKKTEWENYLVNHFGYPVKDSIWGALLYSFSQKQRKAFYQIPQLGIPLRDLRTHFKLKSTWFDVYLEGNEVVLKGHGFGHGVGLCQEGAMKMSKYGYTYDKIIRFYFYGVYLLDYYKWLYFKQKYNSEVM
ncbi:MAG TPA: SpoIID/LytB domain-containing protein [Crocinitomix sp.]|nr:SpoIID/LytB domain-containing protein [Crocinitomix sp.]